MVYEDSTKRHRRACHACCPLGEGRHARRQSGCRHWRIVLSLTDRSWHPACGVRAAGTAKAAHRMSDLVVENHRHTAALGRARCHTRVAPVLLSRLTRWAEWPEPADAAAGFRSFGAVGRHPSSASSPIVTRRASSVVEYSSRRGHWVARGARRVVRLYETSWWPPKRRFRKPGCSDTRPIMCGCPGRAEVGLVLEVSEVSSEWTSYRMKRKERRQGDGGRKTKRTSRTDAATVAEAAATGCRVKAAR